MGGRGARTVGWALGLGCLALFVGRFLDLAVARQALADARPGLAAAALAVFACGMSLRALRWTFVVRRLEPLGWRVGVCSVLASNLVNFLLPLRIGEVARLVVTKRVAGVSYASSTAATFVDRLSFTAVLASCLCLVPLSRYRLPPGAGVSLPVLFGAVVAACLVLFLGGDRLPGFLARGLHLVFGAVGVTGSRLEAALDHRLIRFAGETARRCHVDRLGRAGTVTVFASGLLLLVVDGVTNHLLFAAFGLDLPVFEGMLGACFMNVLFYLPSPPGQVGTAELYPVMVFGAWLGLASPTVATVALFWHAASLALVLLMGFLSSAALGVEVRGLLGYVATEDPRPGEGTPC